MDVQTTPSTRRFARVAILAVFLIIFLGSAFTPALQDDVDTVHAEAAREMLTRHDFVTLHVNGVRYLEKAPVIYWLVAGCYRVLGVSDFATRLPTVLAMLGLVLLAMHWGRRAFGERAGLYSGMFLTTIVGSFLFTRVMIPEAILSLLIGAAFYCLVAALEKTQAWWEWYGIYALLAVAVLTKGLMALVVIGFTIILYLALSGEWRRWREFHLASGLLLFFVIAAPWHILAGLRNPAVGNHHGFLWFYFINEHVLRFLGKRIPHDYNKQPGYLYWSLHLVWLFPWSLYLPLAIRRWMAERKSAHASSAVAHGGFDFRTRTLWVTVLWAVVLLLFFAFSTNQEYYTFPAYLAMVLLLAEAVAKVVDDSTSSVAVPRWRRWLLGTTLVSCAVRLLFAGVLIFGLWKARHVPFVPDIGEVLSQENFDNYSLSMGHMFDLTGASFAALRLPTVLAILSLVVGSLAELWFCCRKRYESAIWSLALAMMLFMVAAHVALVRFDPYLSSHSLAQDIQRQLKPEDHVMIYGDHAFGSSLVYYLPHTVELVNGRTTSMWFGSTFPDAPHIFLDDSDLLRLWNSPTRVFLFTPEYERKTVVKLLGTHLQVYARRSAKIVYVNH